MMVRLGVMVGVLFFFRFPSASIWRIGWANSSDIQHFLIIVIKTSNRLPSIHTSRSRCCKSITWFRSGGVLIKQSGFLWCCQFNLVRAPKLRICVRKIRRHPPTQLVIHLHGKDNFASTLVLCTQPRMVRTCGRVAQRARLH